MHRVSGLAVNPLMAPCITGTYSDTFASVIKNVVCTYTIPDGNNTWWMNADVDCHGSLRVFVQNITDFFAATTTTAGMERRVCCKRFLPLCIFL